MFKTSFIFFFCFSLLSCINNSIDTNIKYNSQSIVTKIYKVDSIDNNNSKTKNEIAYQSCKDLAKIENGEETNKATISLKDSSFIVEQNKFYDHQIFGYEKPDTKSKKIILISCFTYDVENNPYKCKYGAFYTTNSIDSFEIKFVTKTNFFVKCKLLDKERIITNLFFEKRFVEFVD